MLRIFLCCVLLLMQQSLFSQFSVVSETAPFDEPVDGFAKILLLKNGTTAYFQITYKHGIEVRIYDEKHREKKIQTLDPAYSHTKQMAIESLFEIRGDIVLFVSQTDEKSPMLYRLIIDGKTGMLKKDEKIAELGHFSPYKRATGKSKNEPPARFFVRKDPASDHYALAKMNSADADPGHRLEIIYYGSDNKEIAKAFYASPQEKYEFISFLDMVVIGDQKVSLLAFAYNKAKHNGRDGELVIANLDSGAQAVSLDELEFSKELVVTGGAMRFNPISHRLIFLGAAKAGEKNEYVSFVAFIDPFERTLSNVFQVYPERADAKSTELFGKHDHFTGMPQDLYIDHDGSFAVVFEEVVVMAGRGVASILGHLAVMKFDPNGKETGCYFIPKKQYLNNIFIDPFYHALREGTAQELLDGAQYKSFAYLHGNNKSYILFNDIERNAQSVLKGNITQIQSLKDCDGFYFLLAGDEVMPARQFVFGREESRKDHDQAIFTISDYDHERNIYATLKMEKEGRSKQVKLVWIQPQ